METFIYGTFMEHLFMENKYLLKKIKDIIIKLMILVPNK